MGAADMEWPGRIGGVLGPPEKIEEIEKIEQEILTNGPGELAVAARGRRRHGSARADRGSFGTPEKN